MRNAPKNAIQLVSAADVAAQIGRLSGLSLADFRTAWAVEFGRDPPKGLWRDLLLRTLVWRLQERAFGGHDKATLKLLEAQGQKRTGDERCRRGPC
jgi:Protein of unknown function (DUF2924)